MNRERAYKYRFYPSEDQVRQLAQTFGCTRYIYNHALDHRTKAWNERQERLSYNDTSRLLTQLKKQEATAWLKEVSSVALQQKLRDLDGAFSDFFNKKLRKGYPKFKSRKSRQSFRLTNNAFVWDAEGQTMRLAKQSEPLDIRWSRRFSGAPSSVTISKDQAGRYFISMLVKEEIKPLKRSKKLIGADLGIKQLIITSEGRKYNNRRYTTKYADRLAKAQRKLKRLKKGSNNWKKQKLNIAKVHAKIADSRNDRNHWVTSKLIKENQLIGVEDLAVKNMVKNPKLSKAISDCSWGSIVEMLAYKADWYGRDLVKIDRFFPSSKRCSDCGHINESLALDDRAWSCPSCQSDLDRDVNAAINIKKVALAKYSTEGHSGA